MVRKRRIVDVRSVQEIDHLPRSTFQAQGSGDPEQFYFIKPIFLKEQHGDTNGPWPHRVCQYGVEGHLCTVRFMMLK